MALFGRRQLVNVPADLTSVEVGRLQVHTAESLVIVTVGTADVAPLLDALTSPTALISGDTRVIFVPVKDSRLVPAHDPKQGWIIPVSGAVAESVVSTVRPEPGGYEIDGMNVAFIVE